MFEIHASTRHFELVPGAPPLNEESHLNVRNGRGVQTVRVMQGNRVIKDSVEPIDWMSTTTDVRKARPKARKTPKARKMPKKVRKTRKAGKAGK